MSAIANIGGAPAALPPVNLHAHGHKRGGHVQATDDTGSDSSAQVPPGLRQNLFGSLLNSLEQAIGVQSSTAAGSASASATGSSTAATAGTTANTAGADGANAAATPASATTASAQSSITLLQNYLNNLAHNSHADGSPAAKFAGSNVSVSA